MDVGDWFYLIYPHLKKDKSDIRRALVSSFRYLGLLHN
jgi:hypothetical protein